MHAILVVLGASVVVCTVLLFAIIGFINLFLYPERQQPHEGNGTVVAPGCGFAQKVG
jgi:hypothetical protein